MADVAQEDLKQNVEGHDGLLWIRGGGMERGWNEADRQHQMNADVRRFSLRHFAHPDHTSDSLVRMSTAPWRKSDSSRGDPVSG